MTKKPINYKTDDTIIIIRKGDASLSRLLSGKNVIVTGSNRGIGKKTVEILSENGANIWACARLFDLDYEKELQTLSSLNNVKIWPVYFDLTNPSEIKDAVQIIKKTGLKIDGLINVAGYLPESTSYWMTSIDKIKKTFEINYYGPTILTQFITRLMVKDQNKGCIINVASIEGMDGLFAPYEYISSKSAIIGGTKYLAHELADYGIRVNAISPGWTNSDMTKDIRGDIRNQMLNKISMKRFADADEIANVIVFLISDLSSYITGQVIRVDGGVY